MQKSAIVKLKTSRRFVFGSSEDTSDGSSEGDGRSLASSGEVLPGLLLQAGHLAPAPGAQLAHARGEQVLDHSN